MTLSYPTSHFLQIKSKALSFTKLFLKFNLGKFMLDEESIITRCPHNKENPYTSISNELITDNTISPECRWLIIYLLSRTGNWKLSIKQIRVEQKLGRDSLYKSLNEAIEAGYIRREEILSSGLKRYKYYISEFSSFRSSLPKKQDVDSSFFQDIENQDKGFSDSDFPDAEEKEVSLEKSTFPDPENQETFINNNLNTNLSHNLSKIPPPSPPPNTPPPMPLCKTGGGFLFKNNRKNKNDFLNLEKIKKELPQFPERLILKAIEEAQRTNYPISSPIKYLEKICNRLKEKYEKEEKANLESEKIKEETKENRTILTQIKKLSSEIIEKRNIRIIGDCITIGKYNLSIGISNFKKIISKLIPEFNSVGSCC